MKKYLYNELTSHPWCLLSIASMSRVQADHNTIVDKQL